MIVTRCEYAGCSRSFTAPPYRVRRFCSHKCYSMSMTGAKKPFTWTVDPKTNCWNFDGAKNSEGYPMASWCGRVHRYLYEELFGTLPPEKPHVLHSCDNPSCINPEHLRAGTPADNAQDKVSRSRTCRGASHHRALFDEKTVRRIRSSNQTQRALATKYGVDQSTISLMRSRKTWKHI